MTRCSPARSATGSDVENEVVPESGGDTLFADMRQVFAALLSICRPFCRRYTLATILAAIIFT